MMLHLNPLAVDHLPLAGRLKHCISNWVVISKDPWVLETVQGFHLDLVGTPHQLSVPLTVPHTKENMALIDLEIQQMLDKKAIHVVPPGQLHQGFVSSIFLVPKKGGGQRPVVNLRPLNQFIPYEHFKMEGIHMLRDLLRKGDFMVKIDLKDAYFTVPVWKNHQKFLRFVWKETMYEFACLPFGLASAPRVFTKLIKPVVALLRQLGIRLIVYLDDMLIMAQSRDIALQHASTALDLLQGLGFMINYLKSVLVPSTRMEFLGFVVDSLTLSLAHPREKIRKVRKECQTLLDSPLVTVRQLAKLLGHLTSTIQAVFPGPLHFRHLQNEKNRALVDSQTYDSATPLSPQAKEELVWWRDNLEAWNGKALVSGSPDRCLPTRLGGILQRSVHRGSVVSRGITFPHKLSRTSGWGICCQDLCERQSSNASPLVNGQFDCRPLHQQDGGHKIPSSGTFGIRSMGVVPSPQCPHRGSVFTRGTRCPSRPRISSISRPSRLETGPPFVRGTKSGLGPLGGRPFCLSSLNSTSTVLQLETRPSFRGSGCVFPGLEQSEGICIPSLCSSRPLPQTVTRPECVTPCSSCTGLAVTAMVPSASRVVCSTAHSVPSLPGPADTTRRSAPLVEPSTSRLATIRQSYSEAGISQPAQILLVAAWRDGTSKAYASAWRRWDSWCRERKLNSVHASVESILEFLTSEFNLGRAYRTLNVYRSAISSTHPKIDSVRVGEHPLVVQLLKGAYNLRPPLP